MSEVINKQDAEIDGLLTVGDIIDNIAAKLAEQDSR